MEGMPVSVAISQFKQKIVDVINNSGLHISIIEMVFRDVYADIKGLAQQTAQQEAELVKTQQINNEENN